MSKNAPWLESPHTQIWNVTERARTLAGPNRQDDASLGAWFTHAPWMAPLGAWHWHYSGLIHLRDMPGQSKPATIAFPGATHEFICFAIDPTFHVDLDAEVFAQPKFLSPMSISQQFIARNDAEALGRVEQGLHLVVNGRLSLESDGRHVWRAFLTGKP